MLVDCGMLSGSSVMYPKLVESFLSFPRLRHPVITSALLNGKHCSSCKRRRADGCACYFQPEKREQSGQTHFLQQAPRRHKRQSQCDIQAGLDAAEHSRLVIMASPCVWRGYATRDMYSCANRTRANERRPKEHCCRLSYHSRRDQVLTLLALVRSSTLFVHFQQ